MNKKCQVFTPENYVEELLNSVGYTQQLYGKKILENSCGDGNILTAIVRRYIADCKQQGLTRTKIKNGLARDIYGVEIDPEQYEKCIENLNQILESEKIKSVKWNIINGDYLRWNADINFDFVVGNPPYITYKELDKKEQDFVRNSFETCVKGKFDYCYAFIEKSIKNLNNTGRMAYLIPSSIFKTVFGLNLRNYIKPYIEEIKDYTQEKMFNNALIKSSIMVLDMQRQQNVLHYSDMTLKTSINIPINTLVDKWNFTDYVFEGECRFGDLFKVSNCIATLANKIFIHTVDTNGQLDIDIETNAVRVAKSPKSEQLGIHQKIIFPYYYENGEVKTYSEKEMHTNFPKAMTYLNSKKDALTSRDSDKNAMWYEFGRSQALRHINQKKLFISTIITKKVRVYELEADVVPYSGIYIIPKGTAPLDEAKTILQTKRFYNYLLTKGVKISGDSIRISSKDVEEYRY